jgi:hypothetical protein
MPTWYEYERECDEIDDYLISEQKKAQKTLQNTLRTLRVFISLGEERCSPIVAIFNKVLKVNEI